MTPSDIIKTLALALLFLCTTAQGNAQESDQDDDVATLLHHERSLYSNIYVFEIGIVRCMHFNKHYRTDNSQSCFFMDRPELLFYNYSRVVLSTLLLKPDIQNILIVGLGGGTLPTAFSQAQTGAQIDVVEIDPAVTRVARTYFPFGTNEQLRTHEADGRVFVKRAIKRGETYDLVVLDAFNSEYIPEHMLTREYLEEVKSVISPGGVLVANTFSHSALYDSESVTYKTVFGDFINVRVGNRLILWQDGGLPTRDEVLENAPLFKAAFKRFGFRASWLVDRLSWEEDWKTDAPLLTDQYSPSNLLH